MSMLHSKSSCLHVCACSYETTKVSSRSALNVSSYDRSLSEPSCGAFIVLAHIRGNVMSHVMDEGGHHGVEYHSAINPTITYS